MHTKSYTAPTIKRGVARSNRATLRRAVLEALEPRTLLSTTLVSADPTGVATVGGAGMLLNPNPSPNFSPNGRFALFTSTSAAVVAGVTDTNDVADVFLRDLQTGVTSIISANASGTAIGSGPVRNTYFSPDSRYLVFQTNAANMVAGIADTNGLDDLFVRDLQTGVTSVVSINAAGTSTGNGAVMVDPPVFSPDGRYLAFVSQASDMVTGVTDTSAQDVFVRDLQAGTTSLISINASGTASGLNVSKGPLVFSPDGRYLAFDSFSSNLVPGFTGYSGSDNLFVRDRETNTTTLVTRSVANQATGLVLSAPYFYQFTPDSGTLIYVSGGANMVAGVTDTNQGSDIYAWNASSNTISMLSVTADGTSAGDKTSLPMGISPDGRYLAFTSASTNLTPQSAGGDVLADLYVRDLQTGVTTYVAVNATASVAFPAPTFSPDSKYLLFQSDATSVVPGITDSNGLTDLFLYNLHTSALSAATINAAGTATADAQSFGILHPVFSPDGRYLAFSSDATNLAPGVTSSHNLLNLYVRDLQANTTTLVTAGPNNADAGYNPYVFEAQFSPDSQFLTFMDAGWLNDGITTISNLLFNTNVYAFNLPAKTLRVLSVNAGGTGTANGSVQDFAMNPAGGSVLFLSNASDMVAGVTDTTTNQPSGDDVFLATLAGSSPATGSSHVTVSGLSTPIAAGDLSPSLTDGTDFGSTPVNTAVSRTYTVNNTGTIALTTSGFQLPGGFTLTEPLSTSIAAGASDTFTVRFDATAAHAFSGNVTFNTNDTTTPAFTFAITGTATSGGGQGLQSDLVIEGGVTGVRLGTFVGGSTGGRASVKVFNRGAATATGSLQVTFYASADGTLDGTDTPLVTVTKKTALRINKSLVYTGTFRYPVGIPDGQYFILAKVDPANVIAESNETNNTATSLAAIGVAAPFVDLLGTALAPVGAYKTGRHATASLTVQNAGNITAAKTITLKLVMSTDDTLGNGDDIVVATVVKKLVIKAKAKPKILLGASLLGVVAGPYHLFAIIDSTNALTESDETNNTVESVASVTVV